MTNNEPNEKDKANFAGIIIMVGRKTKNEAARNSEAAAKREKNVTSCCDVGTLRVGCMLLVTLPMLLLTCEKEFVRKPETTSPA